VWDAARHLVDYCESEAQQMGLLKRGATVLELGAGCGFVGMIVALNCPALGRCAVTEMEEGGALEHLRYNVNMNADVLDGRVEVMACDWRDFGVVGDGDGDGDDHDHDDGSGGPGVSGRGTVLDAHWDVVLGSDLVYNEAGVEMLPTVLARLVAAGSAVYYCHTKHRYDMMDADFVAALEARGLVAEEVWKQGEQPPPPSPPPFECLFNEHRLVVWRITAGAS
jgi:predicted nicotinamide N-methyase